MQVTCKPAWLPRGRPSLRRVQRSARNFVGPDKQKAEGKDAGNVHTSMATTGAPVTCPVRTALGCGRAG